MARVNVAKSKNPPTTHEGGRAARITPEQQLRRSVMNCLLWENEFYEDGQDIATRILDLVEKCKPEFASSLAIEARNSGNLRHVPLWIAKAMCNVGGTHRALVADTLASIVQRPDELTEFMALYWKSGRIPVAAQVKKGLARAFGKFNEYQLSKYNRDTEVKLRDVMFLCHPTPKDEEQAALWKRLAGGNLATPDTWEVGLSAAKSQEEKNVVWTSLLTENKLGALALLRNLRNMGAVGVDRKLILNAIKNSDVSRVLPFRFVAAWKHGGESLSDVLERKMMESIATMPKIGDSTIILVDVSGSMDAPLSAKSDMTRLDAGCALATIGREMFDDCRVFTFSHDVREVSNIHGFGLIQAMFNHPGRGSTYLNRALNSLPGCDRLIVVTDEQSHDGGMGFSRFPKQYLVNVASAKNGVGYHNNWRHIDGFSENIFKWIAEVESSGSEV